MLEYSTIVALLLDFLLDLVFDLNEKFLIGKNFYDVMKENGLFSEDFETDYKNNESKEVVAGGKCYNVTAEAYGNTEAGETVYIETYEGLFGIRFTKLTTDPET